MTERCLTRRDFVGGVVSVPLIANLIPGLNRPHPADTEVPSKGVGHLNYHPQGLYVWDSWYFTRDHEIHVIHLQKRRPGSDRPDLDAFSLGLVVSTDLLTWTELSAALSPGPEGSVDDFYRLHSLPLRNLLSPLHRPEEIRAWTGATNLCSDVRGRNTVDKTPRSDHRAR
jgi:hypothetical protein